ncbi:LamG-like jellyroll fold domain-containing protein [Pseudopedobacter beijingensis]|uniref:LamG-like jellyroll fold domain-containing protein n=1 Tax=Pseudopedobacter beijingensis TaxID=1207056 RepID=A0ABW4IHU2_9SPHI
MMKNDILKLAFLSVLVLGMSACKKDKEPSREDCDDQIVNNYNNGLVAYYKFPGGSLDDFSGNNHHGNVFGNVVPTTNAAGTANCAVRFNGTDNDYIKVNSHTDFDFDGSTPISIVLWYKPEDIGTGSKYQLLFSRGTGPHCPDTYGEFSLGLYDNLKPVFGYNQHSVWDSHVHTITNDVYNYYLNEGWQNLIAIYDPASSDSWKIYRDGNLSDNEGGLCGPAINLSGDLYIGRDFKGSIDDIKVYSRALSAAEINFMKSYVSPCCE